MKNNLKQLRKEAALTLDALADAAGIGSKSTLFALERGDSCPRLDTAYAIAAVLDKDVEDIWPDETSVVEETVVVRRVRKAGRVA